MTAIVLKGFEAAKKISADLKKEFSSETNRLKRKPVLAVIRIGNAKEAELYAKSIQRVMDELSVELTEIAMDDSSSENEVVNKIQILSRDEKITGILLLSPVPPSLNHSQLCQKIPPQKDIEGSSEIYGWLSRGIYPPTALAVLELIHSTQVPLQGKEAVVIGRSKIVGQPVSKLLLQDNATVTICHSKTVNLEGHVRRADILVACAGRKGLIKGEWIKNGAVVIDAAENVTDGKVTGDVDFESALNHAGYITPVPSGVGPLTTYMLGRNLLTLLQSQQETYGNLRTR